MARKQAEATVPVVSVVVVTYNSADVLPGLLHSLPQGFAGVGPYEVIVVDNASRDGSAALARAHPSQPMVIETGRNAGFAAGINAAAERCDPRAHLLILNPDTRLEPGSVAALLRSLDDPAVGVAVPRQLTEKGVVDCTLRHEPSVRSAWADALLGGRLAGHLGWSEIVRQPEAYHRQGRADWATGAALLVAAHARLMVGGWDESFFLYSEEVEYQRRVRAAGFAIVYVPDACVVHRGGDYQTNPKLLALLTANRIRYFARYHGPVSSAAFRTGVVVGEALRAARNPVRRQALLGAMSLARSPVLRAETVMGKP